MKKILLAAPLAALLFLVAGCVPEKEKTASTEDETVNLLASDPTQGFKDFQAVGTDGVTSPDCCKVPVPNTPKADKTKT